MTSYSWTCPHCERPVTIRHYADIYDQNLQLDSSDSNNVEGSRWLAVKFIVCPNHECKKFTLLVELKQAYKTKGGSLLQGETLQQWQLVPSSKAKSFPDYIPQAILDDYNESCLIKDLSPKASATLARRCLQGIIRDFWGVKGDSLKNEIEQIKDKVEELTWQAIDAVRSVGNIGAHMEEDVNLIVDIESNEAELLIGLIETLLKEWYIARHNRESQLQALVELGKEKDAARKQKEEATE